MKRVFISLMCLIAMLVVNTGLKAQEITITLNPGWNWISYPRADTLSFTEAMGSFVPVEGDIIESQYGITEYYFDMGWFGTLEQFYPGWGYLYYSNRTTPVAFTFQLQQPVSPVTITTLDPTDVTASSAIVVSMVTTPEGCHVFLRGLCWGTEPNPDINDDHIAGDAIAGSQSYTMDGLTPNTTYYVRSYAVTDYGLAYGDEQSFTPDYVYVDLGLPSGTLWAICNVGASTPEGCGDYFAWGETKPKDIYYWSTSLVSR